MSSLSVTLVQANLAWESIEENLERFETKLRDVSPESDLVILPEMFSTGFTMNPQKLSEPMEGPTMEWMHRQAELLNSVITGSIIIEEEDNFYNRLIWMRPDGSYELYDKRHLFRLTDEQKVYTPGKEQLIVDLNGWKVCPQVCYDLRFPVWGRNRPDPDDPEKATYDLIFYNANWPQKRSYAWQQLLKARAIENQAYVIGVNRVGKDGNDIYHSGDSTVIDPLGHPTYTLSRQEGVQTVQLSKQRLQNIRSKFQFLRDADAFTLEHQSHNKTVNP